MGVWKKVWQNWPKCLDSCPVWTAATGTNKANIKMCPSDDRLWQPMTRQPFWALKMSKKSILGTSYRGLKKGVAKSAKMPWRMPSLYSCHITGTNWAEIQTFLCPSDSQWPDNRLGPENVPKAPSRPKLWAFAKKFLWNLVLNGRHRSFLAKLVKPSSFLTPHRPAFWIFLGVLQFVFRNKKYKFKKSYVARQYLLNWV